MARWIDELAAGDPVAVLGVLCVAFGLTDAGLRYYSPYGTGPKPHWMAFSSRMNEAAIPDADADRIVAAAAETFERIGHILTSLSEPRPAAIAV